MNKAAYTVTEAAKVISRSPGHVRRLIREKKLEAIRLYPGAHPILSKEYIDNLVAGKPVTGGDQ